MQTLQLTRYPIRASEFFNYPVAVQQAVQELEDVMHAIDASVNPRQGALAFADNSRPGWSAPHLRRTYDKWVASNREWRTLLDERKYRLDDEERLAPLPDTFRDHVGGLMIGNQRKDRPAWRKLIRQWHNWRVTKDRRFTISGYEECPAAGPNGKHPLGWSYNNLRRFARPPKVELIIGRIGIAAAMTLLPPVPRTRVGVRPLEYVFFDDVWQDREIMVPGFRDPARLLQLGCLDYATAAYLKFGLRPELPTDDGTRERLKETDMKWLVARLLEDFGYPADYNMYLVLERGTATLREADARALYDLSGGRINVCYTNMQGGLVLVWEEKKCGNSRGKAPLESWHNLFHNELADQPGQVGMDREHFPAATYGMRKEAQMLHDAGLFLSPQQRGELLMPYPDLTEAHLQTQDVVHRINTRGDHNLEGFDKEVWFRVKGVQMDWQPPTEFDKLPVHLRQKGLVEFDPRLETPMNRFYKLTRGVNFLRIPNGILTRFYEDNHRIEKVKANGQITFKIEGKTYTYEPETPADILAEGTEVCCYLRPLDMDVAHLTVKGKFIGTWQRTKGIAPGDSAAKAKAMARQQTFLNHHVANVRRMRRDYVEQEEARQQHNWRELAKADMVPSPNDVTISANGEITATAAALHEAVTKREATQVKPSTAKEIKRDILSAEAPAEETENQPPESWA